MLVRLHSRFDWRKPGRAVRHVKAFKPGDRLMTKAQGEQAIALGLGKEIKKDEAEDAERQPPSD